MRAMLHPFYMDLYSPADTNFSVAPSSWHSIRNFLADSLRFVRTPPHTAIPVGAKLLSARDVQLCCSAWLIFLRLLSPISAYGFAFNASAAPAAIIVSLYPRTTCLCTLAPVRPATCQHAPFPTC